MALLTKEKPMKNLFNLDSVTRQIFANCIVFHRNKIKFFCRMANENPQLRGTMIERAREQAKEIKSLLWIAANSLKPAKA